VHTTAAEALARRAGVCQDYAHVLLALTRRFELASRYISGQMLGFGGSHAWVEVLVPDGTGHARVLSLDPPTAAQPGTSTSPWPSVATTVTWRRSRGRITLRSRAHFTATKRVFMNRTRPGRLHRRGMRAIA